MKIKQVMELLDGELLCSDNMLEEEIEYGYSCDLMSDVLAFVQSNVLLLTGLVHPQVVRTAEMLDIKAILFVRGKTPNDEIISMAKERDIIIIRTRHSLFTASGILFNNGLSGEELAHNEIQL